MARAKGERLKLSLTSAVEKEDGSYYRTVIYPRVGCPNSKRK